MSPRLYTVELFYSSAIPQTTFAVVVAYDIHEAESQIQKELDPRESRIMRIRPSTTVECLKHFHYHGNALSSKSCDILWGVEGLTAPPLPPSL